MPVMKLLDPDAVPSALLGAVLSLLIRAVESDPQARELLAERGRARAPDA
jgi:hypothetical protein